jgi:hypothetical protein
MSSKVIYECFLWFHTKARERKYPNTRSLAEKFVIPRKTARRDSTFMRDRLGAPLYYRTERWEGMLECLVMDEKDSPT